SDSLQPRLPPLQLRRQLVAAFACAKLLVLTSVDILSSPHQLFDLFDETLLFLFHAAIAHRLVLARVGLHLGAIEGHVPKRLQPSPRTQPKHLKKQPRERVTMLEAKAVDRGPVRMRAACDDAKRDILIRRPLDLARGKRPRAVSVQKKR